MSFKSFSSADFSFVMALKIHPIYITKLRDEAFELKTQLRVQYIHFHGKAASHIFLKTTKGSFSHPELTDHSFMISHLDYCDILSLIILIPEAARTPISSLDEHAWLEHIWKYIYQYSPYHSQQLANVYRYVSSSVC